MFGRRQRLTTDLTRDDVADLTRQIEELREELRHARHHAEVVRGLDGRVVRVTTFLAAYATVLAGLSVSIDLILGDNVVHAIAGWTVAAFVVIPALVAIRRAQNAYPYSRDVKRYPPDEVP